MIVISSPCLTLTTCLLALNPGTVLHRCEALLKVVGSRPEHLVPNFFTLLPSGTPTDFQRILDIKVQPEVACLSNNRVCTTACRRCSQVTAAEHGQCCITCGHSTADCSSIAALP